MDIPDDELIKRLELAAQNALGTSATMPPEKRSEAEQVLLSFRNSKPSINVCKTVLEKSSVDTVQFQAASALKDTIIREWAGLKEEMQNSLQQFVLHFIINNNTIQHFVRAILTQILAIMIKMTTVNKKETEHRQSLYSCLTELISSGHHAKQIQACSILSALCIEFSITNKSSNVGLPWELHGKSKKQFEEYDLKVIFELVLNVLRHIDTLEASDAMFHTSNCFCEKFLWIAEQVLNWSFSPPLLSRRSLLAQSENEKVLFKPHADWKNVLLDISNIHLFFSIHKKCRQNTNLCQFSVTCLAQLATLQGPALDSVEASCHYLKYFVHEFLSLYDSVQLLETEAIGIANLCKNIIEAHKISLWRSNHEMQQVFHQFLNCATKLTCNTIVETAKQEGYSEDFLFMEALEILLDMWTTITESLTDSKDIIVPCARQIVEIYVHSHLCPPEGSRTALTDVDEDIDELQEEDRERFLAQLMSISCLARLSPHPVLEILSTILEKRSDLLCQQVCSARQKVILDELMMQNLFEDLHWLVLISGHLLADEIEGETALIPPEIVQCSVAASQQVDQGLSLRVLGSPHESVSLITSTKQHIDPIIRLVAGILRVCEISSDALRSQTFQCLSPQLAQDLVWVLRVWSKSYLLFKEEFYKEISPAMSAAFGPDSEGGKWLVTYVVKLACIFISNWTFETKLLEETTEMLITLTECSKRCAIVASCREFWNLGKDLCDGLPLYDKLSPIVRHHLMSALVMAGTSNMNMYRDDFWEQTMNRIKIRYFELISSQASKSNSNVTNSKNSILSILDLLRGVAEAASSGNTSMIFNFLSGFLEAGSKIMQTYSNDQDVIISVLELFVEVAHKQVCYLHDTKCQFLYEWIFSVLKTFSLSASVNHSKDAEEHAFQDLSLIIELLTHLLTKDFIDFSESDTELHAEVIIHRQGNEISVADVVFYGLGIVLPHINTELLSYPTLCSQYFKLVTFLCEIYPEKVEQLPPDVLHGFLYSLQLGLQVYGVDNCKLSLEALLALTDQCCDQRANPTALHTALVPFIKLVFDVILLHAADMDLMRTAGETFYSMFIFNQKMIMELLTSVVTSQNDAAYRERLISEFSKLSHAQTEGWKPDRKDKTKFIKLLEEIIFNIRGILCVK